jgi:glycosyltransferase involved in cell wall biosynthesis
MTSAPEAVSPLLICLVPARNAVEDLPGLLASVALCCDAVVALDDGSTDGTGALLAASPLVRILLANPRRETYHGWDDAANRAQLLEAVSELNPRWLLWLDADERLDPADARALRQFVTSEAQPDSAYGFRVFPLRNDLQHYEDRCLWV